MPHDLRSPRLLHLYITTGVVTVYQLLLLRCCIKNLRPVALLHVQKLKANTSWRSLPERVEHALHVADERLLLAHLGWLVVDVRQVEQYRPRRKEALFHAEYGHVIERFVAFVLVVQLQYVPRVYGHGPLVEPCRTELCSFLQQLEAHESAPYEQRLLLLGVLYMLLEPCVGPVHECHSVVVLAGCQFVHAEQQSVNRFGNLLRHAEYLTHLGVAHEGGDMLLQHVGEPQRLSTVRQAGVFVDRAVFVEYRVQRHDLHQGTLLHLEESLHVRYDTCRALSFGEL
ncbi:glutaredoxin, putative [Babesia ovata]|uniref:Glutaredoxin, putative n=1 Tax=Babesia ovata TaxID=189622 RepID=A0A2H6K6G0_9APIC|nr:glutaredoxin, putative [Babesia ovata]GBE58571.1 glutaredoxin, putative [Babesia ovata]